MDTYLAVVNNWSQTFNINNAISFVEANWRVQTTTFSGTIVYFIGSMDTS